MDDDAFVAVMEAAADVWFKLGRPIFELDARLTALFLLTDAEAVIDPDAVPTVDGPNVAVLREDPQFPLRVFKLRLAFPYQTIREVMVVEGPPIVVSPFPEADTVKLPDVSPVVGAFLRWYSVQERKPTLIKRAIERAKGPRQTEDVYPCVHNIKIDRRLIEAAKHYGDPEYQLRARFIVRGHWRNQAVGAGRAERRMTWIAPFWKGDEALTPVEHVYKAT